MLLQRLSGQSDLVIGTPVAGRTRREVEPLIGFFVNTLALRLDLSGNPTVRTLLERVRGVTLEALIIRMCHFKRSCRNFTLSAQRVTRPFSR